VTYNQVTRELLAAFKEESDVRATKQRRPSRQTPEWLISTPTRYSPPRPIALRRWS